LISRELTNPKATSEGHSARHVADLHNLLIDRVTEYAICALDPHGSVLTWNAGAERLTGYTVDEVVGRHFSIFYTAEDVAVGKPARALQIAIRTGPFEDEGWIVRKDGSRFWANVLITALRTDDGQLAGFGKVIRDNTERRTAVERAVADARRLAEEEIALAVAEQRNQDLRELAERLRAAATELELRRAEAETANRVKAEFLAAMSHELRTPLNAIGGYAQLLQLGIGGPVTPQQVEHLERIQRSQQHLLGVINDILNFSRIEAGRVEYDTESIRLHDVILAVVPMIGPQARAKTIQVVVDSAATETLAEGDRAKVEQILLNLLSNAVKFTPNGGEIEITWGSEPAHAWLCVRDTGVGIPSHQLEAIFTPFVQVRRKLSSPQEGTGLGLSISRQLARGMRGDLVALSREGLGTTFTLTLPLPAQTC
jgi:PAS domain S-box-containing protein